MLGTTTLLPSPSTYCSIFLLQYNIFSDVKASFLCGQAVTSYAVSCFLFTAVLTNGFSDIKNFAIYLHLVRLPTSAINRDAAIIDPAISKNLLLLSFLSVIIH
jgi:hypothetical protein